MELSPIGSQAGKPPAWMPSQAMGVQLDVRWLTLLVSLGTVLGAAWILRWPQWLVMVLAIALPAAGTGLRIWSMRRFRDLEQEFNMRMIAGDSGGMLRVYGRIHRLSLLLPSWMVKAKLGLIFVSRQQWAAAERALEECWASCPPNERVKLSGPLARTKYELGRWEDLLVIAEQWRERSPFAGQPSLYLAVAHAHSHHGEVSLVSLLLDEAGPGNSPLDREIRLAAKGGGTQRPSAAKR